MTKRLRITKDPQCRHLEQFLTRSMEAGLFNVACANCGSEVGDARSYEDARIALMRVIADPVLVP